ncbi:MAG TPA: GlsB/YeaQ/YmgE family stress response membrane protein [Planctomycetota bacterium]|nr:GlsB/YeaQ/YmgE family stress response membrane protein [Planctomycetota bacterium]
MDVDLAEVLVWLIVGALAGDLVARIVTRSRAGFGVFKNLGLGLAGGLVGGFLFIKLIDLDYGMSRVRVSLQQIVAAALGAVIVLVLARILLRRKRGPAGG